MVRIAERDRAAALLSRIGLILWAVLLSAQAQAHQVQPAVADLSLGPERAELSIRHTWEAPVAGLDLEGIDDTNAAAGSDRYDDLRARDPAAFDRAFREAWPEIAPQITLRAGKRDVPLQIEALEVPEVGDAALPRFSVLRLTAELPPDGSDVVFGFDAGLGNVIVREAGDGDDLYSKFLTNGALTDPIPREARGAWPAGLVFVEYAIAGFQHIIPFGIDHILFVLGLFFLSRGWVPLLCQVAAFTVAHTLTLFLAALGIVSVPGAVVEPLIALSIVYVGAENVLARGPTPWRPVAVFGFGLLHGLGLASDLADVGLPPGTSVLGLVAFNVGVELGQLAVIGAAFLAVGRLGRRRWCGRAIARPASLAIALVGAWWFVVRAFLA